MTLLKATDFPVSIQLASLRIRLCFQESMWFHAGRLLLYRHTHRVKGVKIKEKIFYKIFFTYFYLSVLFFCAFTITDVLLTAFFESDQSTQTRLLLDTPSKLCVYSHDQPVMKNFQIKNSSSLIHPYLDMNQMFQDFNLFSCLNIIISEIQLKYFVKTDSKIPQNGQSRSEFRNIYKLLYNSTLNESVSRQYEAQVLKFQNKISRQSMYSKYLEDLPPRGQDSQGFINNTYIYYICFTVNLLFILLYLVCSLIRQFYDNSINRRFARL